MDQKCINLSTVITFEQYCFFWFIKTDNLLHARSITIISVVICKGIRDDSTTCTARLLLDLYSLLIAENGGHTQSTEARNNPCTLNAIIKIKSPGAWTPPVEKTLEHHNMCIPLLIVSVISQRCPMSNECPAAIPVLVWR